MGAANRPQYTMQPAVGFSRRTMLRALAAGTAAGFTRGAQAAEEGESSVAIPNPLNQTLGGKQFWADELFFHSWHIQRHVWTGHCRLLDGGGRRYASGSFERCSARLDEIKARQNLPPMRGPAVVILHGLGRSSGSMRKLADYLHEQGGYAVFNVTYPTTRGTVADHAATLARVIRRLDGIEELNFVGHSLGNLVIRHWLGDQADPAGVRQPDPRVHRVVMLGPPNHGAKLAEVFLANDLAELVVGKAGAQIGRFERLEPKLATPACEFAIIAGGRETARGYNPLLGEDNDLVVSVESTRLSGARDFALLPITHTWMMDDPTVQEYTLRFLQHGHLVAADQRHPIE